MVVHLAPPIIVATVIGCGPVPVQDAAEAASRIPPHPEQVVNEPNPTDLLLDELERSASDLRDFQAEFIYFKHDAVLDHDQIRTGEVVFQARPGGTKRFAILMERLIVGTRARDRRTHWIFDGRWLVEIDHEEKIFIKREIVPPGETFDPLKFGEGPFPMPIGQPKNEVRARFDAKRVDRPRDETLAEQLGDRPVKGLLLVPKPDAPEAGDFEWAEVFYDHETLLPVGISLWETGGDRKTVTLCNLRRNAGVDEAKLSIREPDGPEWRIDVPRYQE
jgi:hypothetical protein